MPLLLLLLSQTELCKRSADYDLALKVMMTSGKLAELMVKQQKGKKWTPEKCVIKCSLCYVKFHQLFFLYQIVIFVPSDLQKKQMEMQQAAVALNKVVLLLKRWFIIGTLYHQKIVIPLDSTRRTDFYFVVILFIAVLLNLPIV